jgi:hypothetical protein
MNVGACETDRLYRHSYSVAECSAGVAVGESETARLLAYDRMAFCWQREANQLGTRQVAVPYQTASAGLVAEVAEFKRSVW